MFWAAAISINIAFATLAVTGGPYRTPPPSPPPIECVMAKTQDRVARGWIIPKLVPTETIRPPEPVKKKPRR